MTCLCHTLWLSMSFLAPTICQPCSLSWYYLNFPSSLSPRGLYGSCSFGLECLAPSSSFFLLSKSQPKCDRFREGSSDHSLLTSHVCIHSLSNDLILSLSLETAPILIWNLSSGFFLSTFPSLRYKLHEIMNPPLSLCCVLCVVPGMQHGPHEYLHSSSQGCHWPL